MTPLDPRLQAAIGELAVALQEVALVADHLRRDAETLRQAFRRAVPVLRVEGLSTREAAKVLGVPRRGPRFRSPPLCWRLVVIIAPFDLL